jgi:hypothetical protein
MEELLLAGFGFGVGLIMAAVQKKWPERFPNYFLAIGIGLCVASPLAAGVFWVLQRPEATTAVAPPSEAPVPPTSITFTQEPAPQRTPGYPYVVKVVLQTDHKIDPFNVFLALTPGAKPDNNVAAFWGVANGATESLYPRSYLASNSSKTQYGVLLRCNCIPAFDQETPYQVFLQSKSPLTVQSVREGQP